MIKSRGAESGESRSGSKRLSAVGSAGASRWKAKADETVSSVLRKQHSIRETRVNRPRGQGSKTERVESPGRLVCGASRKRL